ncbi:MAG: 30S ribosomal protein S8e [Candidatus Diapherotrites archaeon]|nr:30S ribosomal protein S8e [Candidatus Diapherotrites archaeon]
MSESQGRSKRTKTGAKHRKKRDKIKAELGRKTQKVTVGTTKRVSDKARGGNVKLGLRHAEEINVLDPKTKKIQKTKILTVVENKANRHYERMNILTKGAIVKTELGDARITSRPSQEGVVNGILVKA